MSTGRTSAINQALGIALIVFVMLTFILTVTTYLFFGQKFQAEQALAEKETELAAAVEKAEEEAARTKELADFVTKELGEKTVEDVRQEFAALFPDYKEQEAGELTLCDVAKWLDKARVDTYEGLKGAQAAKEAAEAARKKAEDDLRTATDAFEKKLQEQQAAVKQVEEKAEQRRAEFEQTEQKLVEEKRQVLEKAESLRLIIDEIAKGETVLGKDVYEGKDPITRIGLLMRAIRERDKTIQVLERAEILNAIAAADPQVQVYVLEAIGATAAEIETLKPFLRRSTTRSDDSGGIDGRIVSVDPRERMVTIRCESTFGIRPGLVFNVHSATTPVDGVRSVKAVVEVVEVEGSSLVRGRIRRDAIEDPVVAGDTVSTPLWTAGRSLEVVAVGLVDFNGDGKADPTALENLVRRSGGTIARSVGNTTTLLVDAGRPSGGGDNNRSEFKPADEKRRNLEMAEARRLGIRMLSLDAFLEWLGAERPIVASEAVAVPGSRRRPPGGSEDVR